MSRRRFFSGIRYMILGVAALFSIFPFYWMIVGATNTSNDIIRGKLSFGKAFSENITRLMEVADLKQVFYNSMKISVLTVVLSLLVTSMAAYGFEKYKSLPGTAKRALALCKEAGVTMTGAGATFPYGKDPQDSNIRIAPSLPPVEELEQAIAVLCVCLKMAALEKLGV